MARSPVGLRRTRGNLVVVDHERAGLAMRAAALRAAGLSLRAIADDFNASRMPTGSGTGGWHPSSIERLLTSARSMAALVA